MQRLRTWGPLVGSVVLILGVVLRALGYAEAARAIEVVGQFTGLTSDSVVSAAEAGQLVAAGVLAWGVCRKLIAARRKALEAASTVTVPKG